MKWESQVLIDIKPLSKAWTRNQTISKGRQIKEKIEIIEEHKFLSPQEQREVLVRDFRKYLCQSYNLYKLSRKQGANVGEEDIQQAYKLMEEIKSVSSNTVSSDSDSDDSSIIILNLQKKI